MITDGASSGGRADELFQAADVDDRVWTRDGGHPTPFGHALIAQAWLRAVTPTA